ncbi:hypothetical protein TNCV_100841 [Trichonephila clavipes]|nr:hypothetical protein TNCV_100841 [Trichonephila clavipes]
MDQLTAQYNVGSSASVSKRTLLTRIELEWIEKRSNEFQLMSWPPNSLDLNPMQSIWGLIEEHRSDIKYLNVGYPRLYVTTL